MRILLKTQPNTLSTNPKIKDEPVGENLNSISSDIQSEAVYSYFENGRRTAPIIFDIQDQSELPAIVEPWFLAFGADVMVTPVLDLEDFGRVAPALGEIGQRYG